MMNKPIRVYISSLVIFLIAGCASTEPVPDNSFYRLVSELKPAALKTPVIDGTLIIERVRAAGILRERALLYSKEESPEAIKQHHYHHWADSPTALIREQLLTYLRGRNIAQHVALQERSGGGAFRLRVELKQLERMLNADGSVTIKVALVAELESTKRRKPILIKSYSSGRSADTTKVLSSVRLMDEALQAIYSDISKDMEAVLSG